MLGSSNTSRARCSRTAERTGLRRSSTLDRTSRPLADRDELAADREVAGRDNHIRRHQRSVQQVFPAALGGSDDLAEAGLEVGTQPAVFKAGHQLIQALEEERVETMDRECCF